MPALLVRLHFTRLLYAWKLRRTQLEQRNNVGDLVPFFLIFRQAQSVG